MGARALITPDERAFVVCFVPARIVAEQFKLL
jgi:hypothetical protein